MAKKRYSHLAHDDWPENMAALSVDPLVGAGIVARADLPRCIAIVAEQLESLIKEQQFVLPLEDDDQQRQADHAWSERVAPMLVDRLEQSNLIDRAEKSRAIKIAAREIYIRLIMEDRPPQFCR